MSSDKERPGTSRSFDEGRKLKRSSKRDKSDKQTKKIKFTRITRQDVDEDVDIIDTSTQSTFPEATSSLADYAISEESSQEQEMMITSIQPERTQMLYDPETKEMEELDSDCEKSSRGDSARKNLFSQDTVEDAPEGQEIELLSNIADMFSDEQTANFETEYSQGNFFTPSKDTPMKQAATPSQGTPMKQTATPSKDVTATPSKDERTREHINNLIETHSKSADALYQAWAVAYESDFKALALLQRIMAYKTAGKELSLIVHNQNLLQSQWNEEKFKIWRETLFKLERILREKARGNFPSKVEKVFYTQQASAVQEILSDVSCIKKELDSEKQFYDVTVNCLKSRLANNVLNLERKISAVKYKVKKMRDGLTQICEINVNPPEEKN